MANNLVPGPSTRAGIGNPADYRAGLDRQMIVDQLHGYQYETNRLGNLFSASIAATGVALSTSFGTTPAIFVWNPPNSGVELIIREVSWGYVSGTIGAGVLGYGITASQQTAPTGGTAITTVALNGTNRSGKATAGTGSTISAASTLVKLGPNLQAITAASTTALTTPNRDMIDGGIIVPQGALFCADAYTATAGTSPKNVISVTWEEQPLA